MSTVLPTLNDHIRKLARREVRAATSVTKRATAQYRRDIAALKRMIKALTSRLGSLEKHSSKGSPVVATAGEPPANTRFRADGLRSHRARMGLSAKDFGALVGVSALTIYNWETGKARPRRKQLAGLIAVRGLGKREAEKRLALVTAKK
jgi:DNA-binding transcriptional regulator YiaG